MSNSDDTKYQHLIDELKRFDSFLESATEKKVKEQETFEDIFKKNPIVLHSIRRDWNAALTTDHYDRMEKTDAMIRAQLLRLINHINSIIRDKIWKTELLTRPLPAFDYEIGFNDDFFNIEGRFVRGEVHTESQFQPLIISDWERGEAATINKIFREGKRCGISFEDTQIVKGEANCKREIRKALLTLKRYYFINNNNLTIIGCLVRGCINSITDAINHLRDRDSKQLEWNGISTNILDILNKAIDKQNLNSSVKAVFPDIDNATALKVESYLSDYWGTLNVIFNKIHTEKGKSPVAMIREEITNLNEKHNVKLWEAEVIKGASQFPDNQLPFLK